MNLEISQNPQLLCELSVPVTQLTLLGCRLYDDASCLDLEKVVEAMGKNSDSFTRSASRGGRLFYKCGGIEVQSLLAERVASVLQNGGRLIFPDKYKFRIWYGKIVEFAVQSGVLEFFGPLDKVGLVERFGTPDFVDEARDHGDLMSTTYIYKRQIRVSYDEGDHYIFMINIGESLVYDEQSKRSARRSMFHESGPQNGVWQR